MNTAQLRAEADAAFEALLDTQRRHQREIHAAQVAYHEADRKAMEAEIIDDRLALRRR